MIKKFYIEICTSFFVLFAMVMTGHAAVITVINKNDSGPGSLRQATFDANAGDTIDFAPNVRGRILLASGLSIGGNVHIKGPGANLLSVEGNMAFRIFTAGGIGKISGLRISRGMAEIFQFINRGGGILVFEGGNLTVESCWITENGRGGTHSQSGSTLTINNSVISGNDGGGIGGAGTLNLSNSTVSENIGNEVGGISWINGTVNLTNVTVSGNRGFETGGISSSGTTTILNSTVTDNGNISPQGNVGGLNTNGSTVTLKNTIIARNLSSTVAQDVSGAVTSQGNNLIGDTMGGSGFIASDLQNVNPRLGGFANNGGATYTHSLLSGSPAINAGSNTGVPATDQRGVARPQGASVDIGAYESGSRPAAFGKIVFVSDRDGNREIYSVNSDGTNQTRLTTNSFNDEYPDWSPDGTQIVFATSRDGNFEIYKMNADGSAPTRLTTNALPDSEPAWSPDGSKILFVRSDSNAGDPEIFIMDVDGANQIPLTNNATDDGAPSWSPDGTRIVFTCDNSGSAVCKMNSDGTDVIPFLFIDAAHYSPAWSPDGGSIAMSMDFGTGDQEIYFLSPTNVNVFRPLNSSNPIAFAPALSPDGAKLAYHNFDDVGGDLYIHDTDGSNPVLLIDRTVSGNGNSSLPDWFGFNTPTGSSISVVSGTTSISYSSVTISGTTTAVPIIPPPYPAGYACSRTPCTLPSYEIETTATYTAPITVCVQVPSVTDATTFATLRILHEEGGVLVDRTILPPDTPSPNFATKTICARVNSLSPFVVAEALSPSAAGVSVGGRVSDATGRAVSKVRVTITDAAGVQTRSALTNAFGYYRFEGIAAGQTYILEAAQKRYQFAPRILSVLDEITDADLTAEATYGTR